MNARLIDTNMLVYAYDDRDYVKQKVAIGLLSHLVANGTGCLSTQSLAEFFSAVTRVSRIHGAILTPDEAADQMDYFVRTFPILNVTPQIVLEATRGVRRYQLPYWDAQLWATARLNQVPVIFSEDFNVGASLEGVRFVNPFAERFVLENWV